MSITQTVEREASLYLFDLQNYARENGYQADDNWQLTRATLDEKRDLERTYQLIMSGKYLPEAMSEILRLVRSKLNPVEMLKDADSNLSANTGPYLVAYRTDKLKR